MEAMIFGVFMGLIAALGLLGAGICLGRFVRDSKDLDVSEDADVISAKLRVMAMSGVSSEEKTLLQKAADYIDKGN